MSAKYSKNIRIDHHGPIYAKGGMYGPIITPYKETDKFVVSQMIMAGIKVVEVLPNGTEVVLTLDNFDKDNSATKKEADQQPAKEQPQQAKVQTQTQSNKQQQQQNNKQQQKQDPKPEDLQEK